MSNPAKSRASILLRSASAARSAAIGCIERLNPGLGPSTIPYRGRRVSASSWVAYALSWAVIQAALAALVALVYAQVCCRHRQFLWQLYG